MSSQTPTVPPAVSSTMKFILRSPVHSLVSKTVLLITFTGRKSGKTYTTPVDYSQQGNTIYIFTHAEWWRNLSGGAQVTLRLRGTDVQGTAEPVVADKQAVAEGLKAHLQRVPSDARYYAVTLDRNGNANDDEVRKAAQTVVMIRVRLC